jgi:protein SCO1
MNENDTNEREEPGYETRDVNVRAVAWLALSVAGGAAIVLVALWLLLNDWDVRAARSDPAVSPLADQRQPAPEPRLQAAPVHDYQQLREQENAVLHSYGWIDKDQGTVRIPIERAIELLVERGERGAEVEGQKSEDTNRSTEDRETEGRRDGETGQSHSVPPSLLPSLKLDGSRETYSPPATPTSLAQQVGLDQRLGQQAPLELKFRDEEGHAIALGELVKERPVILSLVYYRCPMLCNQLLNGLLKSSNSMSLQLGHDYDIISVSIDPRETADDAAKKKQRYVAAYRRTGAEQGWHFLTGEQSQIEHLAAAVGYRYHYDSRSDQYAHASGIIVLTPDGRISRYFYGIDYPPRDLRLGLVESSAGRIGSAVDQILLLCFHYDPATGKYGLLISRVLQLVGTATALLLGGYLLAMYRLEQRRTAAARLAEPSNATNDALV